MGRTDLKAVDDVSFEIKPARFPDSRKSGCGKPQRRSIIADESPAVIFGFWEDIYNRVPVMKKLIGQAGSRNRPRQRLR